MKRELRNLGLMLVMSLTFVGCSKESVGQEEIEDPIEDVTCNCTERYVEVFTPTNDTITDETNIRTNVELSMQCGNYNSVILPINNNIQKSWYRDCR